jgi:hypothetical protein
VQIDFVEDNDAEEDSNYLNTGFLINEVTFNEANFNADLNRRNNWSAAIRKDLESMVKCYMETVMSQNDIPKGGKLIGNRWEKYRVKETARFEQD